MVLEQQRRSLMRHGFVFLFGGVLLGLATAVLPHAPKWMAAHVGALLTAVVFVAIGLSWRDLTLSGTQRTAAYRCGLVAGYVGLVANIFVAVVDLPGPASDPGVQPSGVPAIVFFTMLAIVVPTTLASFGLVLYGMRGNAVSESPGRAGVAALALLLLSIPALATAQSSPRQIITEGGNPTLPFSPAVKAGGFIYVAGAIGDGATPLAKSDVRAQTRQTLDGMAKTLKAAGASLANAASVTVYLRNASDFAAVNEVYATYFRSNPPARTTVVVTQPLANPDGLVEISMIAIPDGSERTVIHPAGWVKSPAPYSYGIKSGNALFMAGLVSRNGKDNANVPGDVAAQTKTVLENGRAILDAAGMTFADVVANRVYLTDDTAFQAMNAAYRPFFGDIPPARLTVRSGLTSPDYLVEIAMVAVKDATRIAFTTPNADGSAGRPGPNLSSAIRVGNTLYVSGIVGNTPETRGDVKAQATEVLARTGRTLQAAGFAWSDVVDTTVFMANMAQFGDMNTIYRQTFSKDFPARATIGLPPVGGDTLVEMMFVAVK
jgi:aminoacrylate peracid reductase